MTPRFRHRRGVSAMQITVDVPEQYMVDSNPGEFGQRMKLSTALLMFQSGQISAGAASELAGVDRWTFAAECARHNIPLIDYDPGELDEEIQRLRPQIP
jgi:predicted HTH domain antitoxin